MHNFYTLIFYVVAYGFYQISLHLYTIPPEFSHQNFHQYFGLSRQSITSESAKLLPDRWNTKIQVICLWWVSFQAFVAEGCDPLEVSIHRKTTHILYNTLILVVPINPQGHPKSWHFGWMEWHTHSHQHTTWLFHTAYVRCLCVRAVGVAFDMITQCDLHHPAVRDIIYWLI